MNSFHDLFRHSTRTTEPGFPPADVRGKDFPAVVGRTGRLHLWSPGEPILDTGRRLLIGVATWSGYDMGMLDLIENSALPPVHVDVFDIDTDPSEAGLRRHIPGVQTGVPTPFAGLWEDGQLVETAAGHPARELVARACGIPWADMQAALGIGKARR